MKVRGSVWAITAQAFPMQLYLTPMDAPSTFRNYKSGALELIDLDLVQHFANAITYFCPIIRPCSQPRERRQVP